MVNTVDLYRCTVQCYIDLLRDKELTEINLVYLDEKNEFPFRKEIDSFTINNKKFKINYLIDKKYSLKIINEFISKYKNKGEYFICGFPNKVDETKNILNKSGIKDKNIKTDPFVGY